MTGKVRLSDQARVDIVEIWNFIGRNNRRAADLLMETNTNTCEALLEAPLKGRVRDELRANVRS
jgi:plasmid stabilization system protein ParE